MRRSMLLAALCALALGVASAPAEVSLDKFKTLPMLDGGRVKPLDTYARVTLLQLSARSSYGGKPAIHWLARVMFTPKEAMDDKVFRINNPDVAYSLNIEPQAGSRYSFAQLSPAISRLSGLANAAMKIDEKKRTPVESELVRLAENMSLYLAAMNSFQFASPHPDFRVDTATARAIGLEPREEPFSFMELRAGMGKLAAIVQPMMIVPGGANPAEGSLEAEALGLFQNFSAWSQHYRSYNLPIVPPEGGRAGAWENPWTIVSMPDPDPEYRAAAENLGLLASSYADGEGGRFDLAVEGFRGFAEQRGRDQVKPGRIRLEIVYNTLDPFYRAKVLYGLAVLVSLVAMLLMRRWIYWPGALLLGAGALLQLAGMVLRVAISGRAPVANLFETFVFVAWTGAVLGLFLEAYQRKGFGLFVGAVSAFCLMLLSGKYDNDGDTIGVLVAVLNSNFWLTTHVITISLGYAGFCLAGVVGHVWLIQAAINPGAQAKLESLDRMTYAVMAFGLIFAFIGTVLGGIWADQSWGRFWGWDPKENGALLIVLWGALLFHARPAKLIGSLGMAAGSVIGIIVVMMAWFGINLLGVGLHSYGFTSGVANGLAAYVIGEAIFLGVTLYFIKRPAWNGARA